VKSRFATLTLEGGSGIAGVYTVVPRTVALRTLTTALERGVRSFDTAPLYGTGLSEGRSGTSNQQVQEYFGEVLSTAGAQGVYVTTKVGRVIKVKLLRWYLIIEKEEERVQP
jgi:D-threo-aldose 1-dehydrogenase